MKRNSSPSDLIGEDLKRIYPKLKRYALSITRNMDTANDLVHDVIEKLLGKEDLDMDVHLESYAIRAIRNKHIDNMRIKGREVNTSSLDTEAGDFLNSIIDERAGASTISLKKRKISGIEPGDLTKSLSLLGEECLEVLTLFGLGDTYEEISKKINVAIGTVMSRMSRCRSQLQLKLEEA